METTVYMDIFRSDIQYHLMLKLNEYAIITRLINCSKSQYGKKIIQE